MSRSRGEPSSPLSPGAHEIDRRTFVRSAAWLGAGAAGIGVLTGCGKSSTSAPAASGAASSSSGSTAPLTSPPAAGGAATAITFWNSYTSGDRPTLEALIKKFNSSQSAVQVNMTIMPNDVLTQKLLPAYAAKKGPTIVVLDPSLVPEYASKGVFAALDDLYSNGTVDAKVLPAGSLSATKFNGKQYGVPFAATATMMYYNKGLLKAAGIAAPPTTLKELAAYAVKTTKYNAAKTTSSVYGFALPDHAAVATWAVLLQDDGGGVVAADNKSSTFGDAASVAAATTWSDLIKNNHISPVAASGDDTDALFAAGRAAMYINGPWASDIFKTAKVDFDLVAIPAGTKAQTATAISGNLHLSSAASSAEAAAASKFFEFWNSKETQIYWSTKSAYPPNLSTLTAADVAANPTSAAFISAKGGVPYLPGLINASQIDTDVVIPSIQKITSGQGTAATVLPAAAKQIDALLT